MITIALPRLSKKQGPKILLSRVRDSINNNGLARTCSFLWPFYDIALFSSVARSVYKKPFVIRIDGIYFDSEETSGSNDELNRKIFDSIEKSSGVIFQSQFNKRLVESFYGELNKNQIVIPNGADLDVFKPEGNNHRDEINLPEGSVVLITSASWRPHKRLHDVISIFKLLLEDDRKYHLLILGDVPEGELPADVENIHCAGYIEPENLPSWYRTGDIFVFLSWLDHCPNTVVEAIASGLPVICTNQGGTRELVELANAGVVCEVDDEYNFSLVDLYNPPTPDHHLIKEKVVHISNNLDQYRKNINRKILDIDKTSSRYVSFLHQCLEQKM